jgi:hypothetical protein
MTTLAAARSALRRVRDALAPVLAGQEVVVMHNLLTMPFHPGLTEALWQLADDLTSVRFLAWVHDLAACNPDYDVKAPQLSKLYQAMQPVAQELLDELQRSLDYYANLEDRRMFQKLFVMGGGLQLHSLLRRIRMGQ